MKTMQQKLLKYLFQKDDWIEARNLSEQFSVTTRTISSYVKEINALYEQPIILSSYKGYCYNRKLSDMERKQKWMGEQEIDSRIPNIIMKLITHVSMNALDLAEDLYISDSLLTLELKKVDSQLKSFDLNLKRDHYQLSVEGSEENKRKIIASLLRDESNTNLSNLLQSNHFQTEYLSSGAISLQLLRALNEALRYDEHILLNDFGIQNILIHVLVLIDRILADRVLSKAVKRDTIHQTKEYELAKKIGVILEETMDINVPTAELDYLTLVISSNTLLINPEIVCKENIGDYVPAYFVSLGASLIDALEKNYFLHPFSSDFTLKFTIHIMNLVIRSRQGITLKNAYAKKTKEDYPLIYDMALYIVKQLSKKCHIHISEDEVTFLVYHIGSYLLMKQNPNKINACIVYLDYNNIHLDACSALKKRYDAVIDFTITPLSSFQEADHIDAALIITLGNFQLHISNLLVPLRLIPTVKDFSLLDAIIKQISGNSRKEKLKTSLSHFLTRELFDFDIYAEHEYKLIELMVNRCMALNLCGPEFLQGVIEREQLSSTSFVNGIAVPHSLEHVCRQSFLYIVINSLNTTWGSQEVRIIIMIGTSVDDSDSFQEIFDNLIKVLYDPSSLPKLLKNRSYDEFINTLVDLIISHTDEEG